jgi:hypothetical protein
MWHRSLLYVAALLATFTSCSLAADQAEASASLQRDVTVFTSSLWSTYFAESPQQGPEVKCLPTLFPAERRCRYVKSHTSLCGGDSGIIDYLRLYYCWLGDRCAPLACLVCGSPGCEQLRHAVLHESAIAIRVHA